MKKWTYFDALHGPGWPTPAELEPYFLAPRGKEWSYYGGNDNWGFRGQGLYGTEALTPMAGRVDVGLSMTGHPQLGVYLYYSKWDGRVARKSGYSSKNDMTRLREWVRSAHGSPLPVGLFVPFATAWKAVKEFIETDGELPKSIEWIASIDVPPGTFPDP
ncbi:MAG: Imm1 family immunity protein [Bradyrhizobium sp.]